MAKQTVLVCDHGGTPRHPCHGPVRNYSVTVDGARVAHALDLCERHAQPIVDLLPLAEVAALPSKPRAGFKVTPLKTTRTTRDLKKT